MRIPSWAGLLATLTLGGLVACAFTVERTDRSAEVTLLRERAFLQGWVTAASDSRHVLALDLSSDVATLTSGGVPMRTVELAASRSGSAGSLAPDAPIVLPLTGRRGTLLVEPIRRIEAPSDSAAAVRLASEPVKPETDSPYATLYLADSVAVRLNSTGVHPRGMAFRAAERVRWNAALVGSWLGIAEAPVRHVITVHAAPADVRAIYRGLADGSLVVIRPAS